MLLYLLIFNFFMKIGGLERILRKSVMFAVGSSLVFNLLAGCGKEESPTAPENQAPETTIISGPSGTIEENTATFEWGGNDPDGNVEKYMYRLSPDMDIYVETYNTTKIFSDLNNGDYTFYVKAIDNEEKEDPTPAERSFTVSKEYTVILQPGPDEGIDAFISGEFENGEQTSNCDINFNYDELHVSYGEYFGNTIIQINRSYIKFNLDDIPPNAYIIDAILNLNKMVEWEGSNLLIQVSRVTNNWGESTVTWNNQPEFSGVIECIEDIPMGIGSEGWYGFNITNLVSGWVGYEYDNYGFVMKVLSEDGENREARFYSSDYETNPSIRPKLEIKYK